MLLDLGDLRSRKWQARYERSYACNELPPDENPDFADPHPRAGHPLLQKVPRFQRYTIPDEQWALRSIGNWSQCVGSKPLMYRSSSRSSWSFLALTSRVCRPSRPCTILASAHFALPAAVLGPVERPPCARQTALPFIAALRHRSPDRFERAWQRTVGEGCASTCKITGSFAVYGLSSVLAEG